MNIHKQIINDMFCYILIIYLSLFDNILSYDSYGALEHVMLYEAKKLSRDLMADNKFIPRGSHELDRFLDFDKYITDKGTDNISSKELEKFKDRYNKIELDLINADDVTKHGLLEKKLELYHELSKKSNGGRAINGGMFNCGNNFQKLLDRVSERVRRFEGRLIDKKFFFHCVDRIHNERLSAFAANNGFTYQHILDQDTKLALMYKRSLTTGDTHAININRYKQIKLQRC